MPEYRVTFGQQYPREAHPLGDLVHHDGWFTFVADTETRARALAFRLMDDRWSMIYDRADPGWPTVAVFPLGELLRIVDPASQLPVSRHVGKDTGSEILVTVWADGTAELTSRDAGSGEAWAAPITLTVEGGESRG